MAAFGRDALELWHLDPAYSYLNHGTVGATPRYVLEHQRAWVERIERHPAQFMLRELAHPFASAWTGPEPPLMRQIAAAVAGYVGAPPSADGQSPGVGLALVDNITTGANAVLHSLDLGPDDVIAVTTAGYGGVSNVATYVAGRAGATVDVIRLPGPGASPAEFAAAFDAGLRPGTKLAVVDHLSAFSALILPVMDFVAACRAKGVMVLVDGAHVPGQLPLDLSAFDDAGALPDFYAANLHKWCWTPRSSGFLWVAPEHRDWVHPTVVSWGLGHGLAAEFDLPGTRDPSPFLVFPEVVDYRSAFGEHDIQAYCHDLCWSGANLLADAWGTRFTTPEEMIGAMAVIPLPERLGSGAADAEAVRRHLDEKHKVEAPIFAMGDGETGEQSLVVRICTQIYNDHSDIERLVGAVGNAPTAGAG